jgi:hypothetical protein
MKQSCSGILAFGPIVEEPPKRPVRPIRHLVQQLIDLAQDNVLPEVAAIDIDRTDDTAMAWVYLRDEAINGGLPLYSGFQITSDTPTNNELRDQIKLAIMAATILHEGLHDGSI